MNKEFMTQREELYYLLEENPQGLTKKEIRRKMAVDNVGDCILKIRNHLKETNSAYCVTTEYVMKKNRYGTKVRTGLYRLRLIADIEKENPDNIKDKDSVMIRGDNG